MKPFSILDLSNSEALAVAKVLKLYFPWLGVDDDNISVSGADTVDELTELYSALPQVEAFNPDDADGG